MRNSSFYIFSTLVLLALSLNSCFYTIRTVAPTPTVAVVSQPKPNYTTTTTVVRPTTPAPTVMTTATTSPIWHANTYQYLDLHAVASAFAESRSVEEFERILNSMSYMISDLDLNCDGFVDYLRVMEVLSGYTHVLVIQAILGPGMYQDVATITVECTAGAVSYVQVIGEPYLYGQKYIIEPIFVRAPQIYHNTYGYSAWQSPYYWDHFPSYYGKPAPRYLSHYQAYCTTYCSNHHYCRETRYVEEYHYTQYERLTHDVRRGDYATRHPQQSFQQMNAGYTNARRVAGTTTSTTTTRPSTATGTPVKTTPTTTTTTTTTATTTRQPAAAATPTTTATTTATTTRQPNTTVSTRVKANGQTMRTVTTTTKSDGSTTRTTERNTSNTTRTESTTIRRAPATTTSRASEATSGTTRQATTTETRTPTATTTSGRR